MNSRHGDGVWWIELAGVAQPEAVPLAITKALGIRNNSDETLQDALANFVRTRRLLIILDNCEHLLDACAEWAIFLLQQSEQVHILTTSREPLDVMGERVWQNNTLAVPEAPLMLRHLLLQYDSVRLIHE
ncbi:MAG: hypothetical protein HY741_26565 [Chloroflexi bacterium]|nr:hypothetical protein [Chloroflexota bacterium]